MSRKAKLSQHTAILLERARRFGISDDLILSSKVNEDISPFKVAEEPYYSYDTFFSYAETHNEDIVEAIKTGYKMKFNTLGGIQTWLKEKFEFVPEIDFSFVPGKIDNLKLSKKQLNTLYHVLAKNWVMLVKTESTGEIVFHENNFHELIERFEEEIMVKLIIISEYENSKNRQSL
ncbi:hypothetical protein ACFSO7_12520 [Bacillus sp. CGMCC 1.16607]|uniref:hypothetical protein n=1 Tax=Bacillus sp. CGMCC 1.16607 TaxID=3351842 RepID=UPI00363A80F2